MDVVETMITSISSALSPAVFNAFSAAFAARSDDASFAAAKRLVFMPVLFSIQPESTKITSSISLFVTILSGKYEPVPIIYE